MSFYYILGIVLLVLAAILFIWAVVDILRKKPNRKSLLFLLLMAPIFGPLIYFQTKNRD